MKFATLVQWSLLLAGLGQAAKTAHLSSPLTKADDLDAAAVRYVLADDAEARTKEEEVKALKARVAKARGELQDTELEMTKAKEQERAAVAEAKAAKASEEVASKIDFGSADCPCIGFKEVEGDTLVVLGGQFVEYSGDLGSHCKAWDDGMHPVSCLAGQAPGKGKGWCAEPWCYVDPRNCNMEVLPQMSSYVPTARYQNMPLMYSYSTCGSQQDAVMQAGKAGKSTCRCTGFDNLPGSMKFQIGGGQVGFYPGETGGSCGAWDLDNHPLCAGQGEKPDFCTKKWCFVDPCSCSLERETENPQVSMYLQDASFRGKSVYYSYETCGEEDTYTAKHNEIACVHFKTLMSCLSLEHCAWTGSTCVNQDWALCPVEKENPKAQEKVYCVAPRQTVGYVIDERNLAADSFDVRATCSKGYFGTAKVTPCHDQTGTYSISGCSPAVLCLSPGQSAGYDIDERSLAADSFDVRVTCSKGYVGTAKVTPCRDHSGTYSISGCSPEAFCLSPRQAVGYVIDERNLVADEFDVRVTCSKGYVGTAKVTPCRDHMDTYSVSGCSPEAFCLSPRQAVGYVIDERSLVADEFDVRATCSKGYVGTAKVTPCRDHTGTYSVSGCSPEAFCLSPRQAVGYVIDERDLGVDRFDVRVTCSKGYVGTATVTPCRDHMDSYSVSGCSSEVVCVAPEESLGYVIEERDLGSDRFDVRVTCSKGYVGTAKATPCSVHGDAYSVSGCFPEMCIAPEKTHGYLIEENDLFKSSFDVQASCTTGWKGTAKVLPCVGGKPHYELRGCFPEVCVAPIALAYSVTEFNLDREKLNISATCKHGYEGEPKVTPCNDQTPRYELSGCWPTACLAPLDAWGYSIVERHLALERFDVKAECTALFLGRAVVSKCDDRNPRYSLDGCVPEVCTAPDHPVAYVMGGTSLRRYDFDVTASCATGFEGVPKVTPCSKHLTDYTISGCSPKVCWSPQDTTGYMVSVKRLERHHFDVSATCADGFEGDAEVSPCSDHAEAYSLTGCKPKAQPKTKLFETKSAAALGGCAGVVVLVSMLLAQLAVSA